MLKEFIGIYGALGAAASIGLARVRRYGKAPDEQDLPSIAVIVAARNEEKNLPDLIGALSAQNYPDGKVSFWIVDDDSEDSTGKISAAAAKKDSRFHALKNMSDSEIASPKKRALDTAIRACDADWVVTTDADCMPKPGWLKAMASFMSEEIGVVLGYSPLVGGNHPFQLFLKGESWSSAALCAAAAGLKFPFNAFGRNFAFRRSIYLDMGGYGGDGSIASGDDDLFLQRVTAKTDWKAAFAADPHAFVPSKVPSPEKTFNTKVRHMSVGPRYAPGWVAIGMLGNVLFMGLALATLAALLRLVPARNVFKAWQAKWFFDLVMSASALRILGEPKRAGLALSAMTLAPFALWAIWPKALFGNIDWKGRQFVRGDATTAEPVKQSVELN